MDATEIETFVNENAEAVAKQDALAAVQEEGDEDE